MWSSVTTSATSNVSGPSRGKVITGRVPGRRTLRPRRWEETLPGASKRARLRMVRKVSGGLVDRAGDQLKGLVGCVSRLWISRGDTNGPWLTVAGFASLAEGWSDEDPEQRIGHKGLGFRARLGIPVRQRA